VVNKWVPKRWVPGGGVAAVPTDWKIVYGLGRLVWYCWGEEDGMEESDGTYLLSISRGGQAATPTSSSFMWKARWTRKARWATSDLVDSRAPRRARRARLTLPSEYSRFSFKQYRTLVSCPFAQFRDDCRSQYHRVCDKATSRSLVHSCSRTPVRAEVIAPSTILLRMQLLH